MEDAIYNLIVIRDSLGTLQITSSRRNLDTLLGCMQMCDRAIDELRRKAAEQKMQQENANTEGEQ